MENISFVFSATKLKIKTKGRMLDNKVAKIQIYAFKNQVHFGKKIIPSQMEVAPLHCTVDITQKRRLFKNTKET